MYPADILQTAIITPFGLFKFLRLTFGLCKANSTFQRLMDRVLAGLAFAYVYLDDIIISSPSMEQNQQDVEEVFQRLLAAGLVINFRRAGSRFPRQPSLRQRFRPPSQQSGRHQEVSAAARVKQLLAFLGVFNFYRQFVPAMAKILRPLTNSTHGSPKATAVVDWTPPMVAAFDATRTALGAAALLAHPQQNQELAVMVDASADHVGVALQQRHRRQRTGSRSFFSLKSGIRHR